MKTKSSPQKLPIAAPAKKQAFLKRYMDRLLLLLAALLLVVTTFAWSYIGAGLQNSNADQVVNPYLFTSWQTFQSAVFPAAHSMLMKWPLFWLIAKTGISQQSLIVWTIIVSMVTVGGLAWILARIERRPRRLAVLLLGLSIMLLLTPAQSYAGGLLPVNMAMLTTRNLEYLLYIGSLVLIIKSNRLLSWRFVLAGLGLILLFASDRLFVAMSIGGALLLLALAVVLRRRQTMRIALRVLLASIVGVIGASVLIIAINTSGLTAISDGGTAAPYGLNLNPVSLATACIYAALHLLTNIGANPAFDTLLVRNIPHDVYRRLFSYPGMAYGVGLAASAYLAVAAVKLVSRAYKKTANETLAVADALAVVLIATTVAAGLLFVVTNHYYAVDARYLGIGLYAALISLAAYTRGRYYKPATLLIVIVILAAAVVPAVWMARETGQQQAAAIAAVDNRNEYIAAVLEKYKITALAGDYWRVLPTKLSANDVLTVSPLANCQLPRDVLTSKTWQLDVNKPFAYLLPLEKGLTDYPACRADAVIKTYGKPNATVTIKGSLDKPEEQLLIYTDGMRKKALPASPHLPQPAAAIVPVALSALPNMTCKSAPAVMNVVAHQDDDILFMNPDLIHSLDAGQCVRTVYMTAGDAGADKLYWLSRRLGSQAAYESMTGHAYTWVERTVKTNSGQFITITTPRENRSISLIFINLPDGSPTGRGFSAYKYESLGKLESGAIRSVTSVDGESTYSLEQLRATLEQLIQTYQPNEIRTQGDVVGGYYKDHSDHLATSKITHQAATNSATNSVVSHYIGYPVHGMPVNVFGQDLSRKQAAFSAYGKYDGGVCHDAASCKNTAYGAYLDRQYKE